VTPVAATERARAAIGLYGDLTVAWSILLQAGIRKSAEPVDPQAVGVRLAKLTAEHPALGAAPDVRTVESLDAVRAEFADTAYRPGEPLIRAAVADSDLLLAAHHGAVDGLGLLAVLGTALDAPVRTDAVGLLDRPPATSFAVSAARRAAEALFTPPTRLRRSPGTGGGGELLQATQLPRKHIGTAAMTAAALSVVATWNGSADGRIVAAVGASRDGGAVLRPEHRATFLRLRLPAGADHRAIRDMLTRQPPEPDFPASRSRAVRLAYRLLAGRLGATFLVSNLGVVHAGTQVESLAFYPAASGPAGIAFGGASTATTTTLTVRARRRDFSAEAAAAILGQLVTSLQ
jgi:hypothetical protein